MDKLTQFVSKSFDNNNSASCVSDRNSKGNMRSRGSPKPEDSTKRDDCSVTNQAMTVDEHINVEKDKPVAKNWLISDSSNEPAYGIDLSINSSHVPFSYKNFASENFTKAESIKTTSSSSPRHQWFESISEEKTLSPKNSYGSTSSSPIDMEDSKFPTEISVSDKIIEEERNQSAQVKFKGGPTCSDKKICKFQIHLFELSLKIFNSAITRIGLEHQEKRVE